MPRNRKLDASVGKALKKRKSITIEQKVDIIKRSERGETPSNIGKALNFSRSTIGTILKDKVRIMEHVKGSSPMKATIITKQRSGLIIEMERLLIIWLEDQNQRNMPITLSLVQEKARSLFNDLKADADCEEEFAASRGWFNRFKVRANLHNIKVQGDYKLKPTSVYRSLNSRTLPRIIKAALPVTWKTNTKAWVTAALFKDWFLNHFVPAAERYCLAKNIPFKIILLLDNAPGHLCTLDDLHPNVKVVFLPPNRTSLLESVDEGVVASFKAIGNELQLDMNEDDVKELVESPDELTNEDLMELEQQMMAFEEEERELEMQKPKNFSTNELADAFRLIEEGMAKLEDQDSNAERFIKVYREVTEALSCYKDIYDERRKVSY